MTIEGIKEAGFKAGVKYRIAADLRAILDKAREEYGPTEWDEDDLDTEIQSLVFED